MKRIDYTFNTEAEYLEAWKYLYKMGVEFNYIRDERRIWSDDVEEADKAVLEQIVNHEGYYGHIL